MNKARRKQLADICGRIEELYELLEAVRDDEQNALDNIPESLQGSDRYESMSLAVCLIEDAIMALSDAVNYIEEAQA